jgi:hypothetical protein
LGSRFNVVFESDDGILEADLGVDGVVKGLVTADFVIGIGLRFNVGVVPLVDKFVGEAKGIDFAVGFTR